MAIRASSASQIDALVADLGSASPVAREAAVARLTVLGARAVERLLACATSDPSSAARTAAWRTLEAIRDPRALQPAIRTVTDPEATVALAAVAAVGAFVLGPHGAVAVDHLTALALDRTRPESIRVAALRALGAVESAALKPLRKRLATDPSPVVRAEAAPGAPDADPRDTLTRAAEEGLGDDPEALRHAIVRADESAPLPILLRIVERARDRESTEPARRRGEWARVRATAHLALATRGSRLALYDLREALAGPSRQTPVEFLTALSRVGDASCLEPIAAAYARTSGTKETEHDWWREHLADAFRAIVEREGITRRHAVVKKIEKRSKESLEELWRDRAGGAGRAGRAGR